MVNQVFNMNVNYLFECLFGETEFRRKYYEFLDSSNHKIGEWKLIENVPTRHFEYNINLGSALGKPINTEDHVS